MKEELWDIYDEEKQLTGRTMRRNDWNMKPGDYHLTVLAVIEKQQEEGAAPRFLITRRVLTKSWAPGHWEVPGGGVMAGETSLDAVCREIRAAVRERFDARTARAVTIQYGGSMNPGNAAELLSQPDVDGGLIGGASLDPAKFCEIVEAAKL